MKSNIQLEIRQEKVPELTSVVSEQMSVNLNQLFNTLSHSLIH